jgi:hypothetical protein
LPQPTAASSTSAAGLPDIYLFGFIYILFIFSYFIDILGLVFSFMKLFIHSRVFLEEFKFFQRKRDFSWRASEFRFLFNVVSVM